MTKFIPPVLLRTEEYWVRLGYRIKPTAEPKGNGINGRPMYADYDVVFDKREEDIRHG